MPKTSEKEIQGAYGPAEELEKPAEEIKSAEYGRVRESTRLPALATQKRCWRAIFFAPMLWGIDIVKKL